MAYLEHTQERNRTASLEAHPKPLELAKGRNWFGRSEQWLPPGILLALLASWEISVYLGWISALFFPAPTTIARAFGEQLMNGELLEALWATFGRLVPGLLAGGVVGLLLGAWMGWSRWLRVVADPFVAAFHPVPKISILPLVMIIFGIGETSKIVLVAVSSFFPMLINTMAGVQQIAPIHFEVAQNYGASTYKLFTRVIVPGSLPLILTGARLALNTALVITIAVELLSAQKGVGAMIWLAWETLRTEELYVALFATALIGIGFNRLLQFGERRLVYWQ